MGGVTALRASSDRPCPATGSRRERAASVFTKGGMRGRAILGYRVIRGSPEQCKSWQICPMTLSWRRPPLCAVAYI
jgi:hypothetical protein